MIVMTVVMAVGRGQEEATDEERITFCEQIQATLDHCPPGLLVTFEASVVDVLSFSYKEVPSDGA